jgi:hypothetical protein
VLSLKITWAFTTETKLIYFKVENELMLQKDGVAPYKFFACLLQAHCSLMRCCTNVLVTIETDRKAHSLVLYPCTGCSIIDSFTSRNFNIKIYETISKKSGSYINFSTNKGKTCPCDEAPLHENLWGSEYDVPCSLNHGTTCRYVLTSDCIASDETSRNTGLV